MARVLHLLDRKPDYQTQTAVSQLARPGGTITCDSRTIGRGGDFATPLIGAMRLRRQASSFDLVHAWGATALTIAAMSGGRPILYSPTHFPKDRDVFWLRATMEATDVQVVFPTDTMRRAFVQRGVPIARCHLVRPGIEFSQINRRRNEQLRSRLGFGKADRVLLAAGESVRGANHHASILAAAVLHVFDPKHKLLLWGQGDMADLERRYAAQMLPERFVSIATDQLGDVSFEQLLPASDIVLVTADAPVPTLPIAVCMAAALPIVAVVSPTVAELLEDRHSALMVGRCTSRPIAQRVLDLEQDPQLQWTICDVARTEAYEYFSMTRFVSQFRAVYEQFAGGRPVEVPQPAPGAGARFLGRG